jgi:CheY-like chemotaxis protein
MSLHEHGCGDRADMTMNLHQSENDHAGLKVLIVDDTELNLMLLEKCLQKMDMTVLKARDGSEAVQAFQRDAPDMVLMDVVMPVMDGLEATRQIKQLSGDRWVPVVMVTSLYSADDIVTGLEAGAEDYLLKPVNFSILQSKVTNFARAIRMQQTLKDNLDQLRAYRQNAEAENELAMQVMEKMIRQTAGDKAKTLQHLTIPATSFSGDVILGGATPGGLLQVILADGTGHGLAAALNVMPVADVFYAMNDKGLPIEQIGRELNRKVAALMPTGRFVAAVLVATDPNGGGIKVWNGGIPFAAVFDVDGNMLHQWHSSQPPLGLLSGDDFEDTAEVFEPGTESFFFACSDGLLEAEDSAGEPVGQERLLQWLKLAPREDRTGYLLDKVRNHMGTAAGHDDISILVVAYPGANSR